MILTREQIETQSPWTADADLVATARAYHDLRDAVLAWAEEERLNGSWWVDTAINEVVARVERGES